VHEHAATQDETVTPRQAHDEAEHVIEHGSMRDCQLRVAHDPSPPTTFEVLGEFTYLVAVSGSPRR
jgi:hypothetical protein